MREQIEVLKDALRQIHFRSDFNIGGEWEGALTQLETYLNDIKDERDQLARALEDVRRSKFTVGRVEARYPEYNKVLEIVEIVTTPNGLHVIVMP